MKLFSALYGIDVDPFGLLRNVTTAFRPKDLTEDGVLLLHGGADISPSIYKQQSNARCYADKKPSVRDQEEMDLIERAKQLGIPIIGICRGAQLICAMDGGYLVQHIDGHVGGSHKITDTQTKKEIVSNSCHHQMMVPKKYNVILAESKEPVMGLDQYNYEFEIKSVPEVVYFPQMNAIGIQGHPEWMPNSHFTEYCGAYIQEFLYDKR